MQRVIITNYQEVKEELIDYITAVRRHSYNQANYLSLAVDPGKGKMHINIRFDGTCCYLFEVEISSFREIYASCCVDVEEKAIDLLDAAMTTLAIEYGMEIELKPNENMTDDMKHIIDNAIALEDKAVIALDRSSIYPSIFVKTYVGGDHHEVK